MQVQEVAERFGVRYVLEGSVQRSGDRIRVTAQLVDAVDGRHLWAERYDREFKELFALQDEITQLILLAMHVKLTIGADALDMWKDIGEDAEAYRLVVEGRAQFMTFSRPGNRKGEKLFDGALKRQPKSSTANLLMGWIIWQKVILGLSKDPSSDLTKARILAEFAFAAKSQRHSAHMLLGSLDLIDIKHASALAHADRGLELAPSNGSDIAIAGYIKFISGQTEEAVKLFKHAMRHEPDYAPWIPRILALALRSLGRYDESKEISMGLLAEHTNDKLVQGFSLTNLAAIAVRQGDEAAARQYMKKLLQVDPNRSIAGSKTFFYNFKDQAFAKRSIAAFREAGMPENPPYTKPDKPSIAVLPFTNLSDDKEQEYFADGMTDDLITDLSKLSGLIVIARNSVFTYKGRSVKVQEVAKD
ncbi:MAG: tetratricopeptide repeat protein, partial [Alphaproteobacteria bacterium]